MAKECYIYLNTDTWVKQKAISEKRGIKIPTSVALITLAGAGY